MTKILIKWINNFYNSKNKLNSNNNNIILNKLNFMKFKNKFKKIFKVLVINCVLLFNKLLKLSIKYGKNKGKAKC